MLRFWPTMLWSHKPGRYFRYIWVILFNSDPATDKAIKHWTCPADEEVIRRVVGDHEAKHMVGINT